VRSFHASTAADAIALAREAMGDDARLVTTRTTDRGVELVVADADRAPRSEVPAAPRREVRNDVADRLRQAGISAALGERVLASASGHRGLDALDAAAAALAREIPVLPPRPRSSGARVVALVGPTGVGKTTTIAKLAGRLVQQRRRVALVTLDTYRIGAVEQLRAYADLLGAPCEVAFTPAEATRAAARFADRDAVLFDTTGRSPRDSERLAELASTLRVVGGVETLLCVSSAASAESLADTAARFAGSAPAGLVVTKLDETDRCGPAFSLAAERRLPVAFLCAGQEVPTDLERASAERIARLCLRPVVAEEVEA